MIECNVAAHGVSGFLVDFTVVCVDRGGSGIRKVVVRDGFDATIVTQDVTGCPSSFTFLVDGIERDRFPIRIAATDCNDEESPIREYAIVTPDDPIPGVRLPCDPTFCPDDPACFAAQRELGAARVNLNSACSDFQYYRDLYNRDLALAITFTILALAFLILAAAVIGVPIVGQILALVAGLLAAAFLALAGGFWASVIINRSRLTDASERLRDSRAAFDEAMARVQLRCCSGCITVDTSTPECL